MDRHLFLLLNRSAGYGTPVDYVAFFLARYGIGLLASLLLIRWLWPGKEWRRSRHTVILACGCAVFALGLALSPDLLYYRDRPYVALPSAFNMLGIDPPTSSFPSLHATAGFAVALVMGWESTFWALLCWPVAILMSWARVFGGVHYPTDVLGGFLFALITAWPFSELRPDLETALDRIMHALGGGNPSGRLNSQQER